MAASGNKITHSAVANNTEWHQELEKVSGLPDSYVLSKTLVFKPSMNPIFVSHNLLIILV
jgi:hypothetical protein